MNFPKLLPSKQFLSRTAWEIFPVLFGVLIALIINDYRAERKIDQQREEKIELIKDRIGSNMEDLKNTLDNHRLIIKNIQSGLDDERSIIEFIMASDGFKVSFLSSLSYIDSYRTERDLEVSLSLEDISYRKEILHSSINRVTDYMYVHVNGNSRKEKESLVFQLMALENVESSMLETYGELLENLNTDPKNRK